MGHVRYLRESKSYLFFYMQPRKMKFTFAQINMKQVSYLDQTCKANTIGKYPFSLVFCVAIFNASRVTLIQGRCRRSGRTASAGPFFWTSMLSAVSLFSRFG